MAQELNGQQTNTGGELVEKRTALMVPAEEQDKRILVVDSFLIPSIPTTILNEVKRKPGSRQTMALRAEWGSWGRALSMHAKEPRMLEINLARRTPHRSFQYL